MKFKTAVRTQIGQHVILATHAKSRVTTAQRSMVLNWSFPPGELFAVCSFDAAIDSNTPASETSEICGMPQDEAFWDSWCFLGRFQRVGIPEALRT